MSFTSVLSNNAFYATDHKINGERVFPGSAFLEMACFAGSMAGEQKVTRIKDVVWSYPLTLGVGMQTLYTSLEPLGVELEFRIWSQDDGEDRLHAEGRLSFEGTTHKIESDEAVSLQNLKAQCGPPTEGLAFYEAVSQFGYGYGPSFQSIRELYVHPSFALSKLQLADCLADQFDHFILHPSLLDGAFQTLAALVENQRSGPSRVPFALEELEIVRAIPQTCYAYVEAANPVSVEHKGVVKFHIQLLNHHGEVVARVKNLCVRPLMTAESVSAQMYELVPGD